MQAWVGGAFRLEQISKNGKPKSWNIRGEILKLIVAPYDEIKNDRKSLCFAKKGQDGEDIPFIRVPTTPRSHNFQIHPAITTVFSKMKHQGTATIMFKEPVNFTIFISRAKPKILSDFLLRMKPFMVDEERSRKRKRRQARHEKRKKKKSYQLPSTFSEQQKRVMETIIAGKNVFMTGSAGTGKSFVIAQVIKNFPPNSTYCTACTGVAAAQIGGTTIYSFAGIGPGTNEVKDLYKSIMRKQEVVERWRRAKMLIIDEISMLDGAVLTKLEILGRAIRQVGKPFGGIQLLLTGDFLQLPPVSKGPNKDFAFQSKAWDICRLHSVKLKKVFRQKDSSFQRMLEKVRFGNITADVKALIQSRVGAKLKNKAGVIPTQLLTHKKEVDKINMRSLGELRGEPHVYIAVDSGLSKSSMRQNALACPARSKLILKMHAQITLLKNICISEGLVNGGRGIVVGFQKSTDFPTIRFVNGLERVISPITWNLKIGGILVASRKQIPLDLGWALSIHKSQGMSLDLCYISLKKAFEWGQAYVALSRARTLEGLALRDFDASKIKAHPEVLRFYNCID